MKNILEDLPKNDPLANSEQKRVIDQILLENKGLPGTTMVVLNELQSQIGFIFDFMQQYVALKLRVPVSSVHGVVSFYSFFTTILPGRYTVKFCMGTACYVGGAQQLIEKAKQIIGIEPGQTTKDSAVTLEICRYVGACPQAPVIVVDDESHGFVRPNKLPQILRSC